MGKRRAGALVLPAYASGFGEPRGEKKSVGAKLPDCARAIARGAGGRGRAAPARPGLVLRQSLTLGCARARLTPRSGPREPGTGQKKEEETVSNETTPRATQFRLGAALVMPPNDG